MNDFSSWSGTGKIEEVVIPYQEKKDMYFIISSIEKDKIIKRGVYASGAAKEYLKSIKSDEKIIISGAASRMVDRNLFIKITLREQVIKLSKCDMENISLWCGSGNVLDIKKPFSEENDIYFIFQSKIDNRKLERGIFVKGEAKVLLKDMEVGDRLTLLNCKEAIIEGNVFILVEYKEQIHQQPKITITADEFFKMSK